MNESHVLELDLFEGDFGNSESILENKIVKTRKKYEKECHICNGDIEKGELSRSLKEVIDGKIGTYRVCNKCCEAISKYYDSNFEDEELDRRYEIGYNARHA